MAKAKKLPSGNWRVQVQKNGTMRSFTAESKKEAEYLAAAWVRNEEESTGANMTIKTAMEKYCEAKKNVLSPSTIRGYKTIMNNSFTELQKEKVQNITNAKIQVAVNDEAGRLSPKSVSNAYSFLCAVLKQYRPDFNPHATLPRRKKQEAVIPTPEQVNELLAYTKENDTEMYIAILLASCLGLRRGEICALEWTDIDFDTKLCNITKATVRNDSSEWVEKAPKTESGRRAVPVSDAVLDVLKPLAGEGKIISVSPNTISDRFYNLTRQKKIDGLRFHNLRHYMASVMLALGVPDKYAMEIMGHATNNMLKTVYQHTMDFKRQESISKINAFFDEHITP